ncbi:hypothetical protein [Paenibacillus roseipurpureus]|uniref:Zinc-ribbon domain-containing protein n=1 Tax=Paenibacillus roseopurpureus TaxID=2918901 RepID=A0AA96LQ61_9BACL|nr:hypothetical protein [Paenibacillus sp. MBLB1832]WNR46232.1 hypothetical protein MJB10_09105 [Paenibacillus sp. MBLB1832]
MKNCPSCSKRTEPHFQNCPYCGAKITFTVAEKFDQMAELVEQALKQELESRRRMKH